MVGNIPAEARSVYLPTTLTSHQPTLPCEIPIKRLHSKGRTVLEFDSRLGAGNFSLHHRVQTGSEAHPASYPVGNRGSFPGG
jgi:hypothetical protein